MNVCVRQEFHLALLVRVRGATRRVSEFMLSIEGTHLPKHQFVGISTTQYAVFSCLFDENPQVAYVVFTERMDRKGCGIA